MENAIVPASESPAFLAPVVSVDDALRAYQAKKDLIDHIFHGPNKDNPNGVDFGPVPGTDKPVLKKAGAEKATSFFGLSPRFHDAAIVEDWTGEQHGGEPFLYYRQTCELYKGDRLIASADGSCNSWEKKYRYRAMERTCPKCGKATIIKGKAEYGGGWICFAKKGGCGAKFADDAPEIVGQQVGQIKNPDVAELANTLLKMSQKRALVAATLIATGLSEYFTQDVEDFIDAEARPVPASGNPDPISDKAWVAWTALLDRAAAANIPTPTIDRESKTTAELRAAYKELEAYVKDAEEQATADDPQ